MLRVPGWWTTPCPAFLRTVATAQGSSYSTLLPPAPSAKAQRQAESLGRNCALKELPLQGDPGAPGLHPPAPLLSSDGPLLSWDPVLCGVVGTLCMSCPGERFWAREACMSLTFPPSYAIRRGWWWPQPLQAPSSSSHSGATASAPRLPGWPGLTQLPSHGAPGDSCPPPPASSTGRLPRLLGVAASRATEQRHGKAGSSCPQAERFPYPGSSPAAPRPSSTLPLWNSQRLWCSGITRWL